MESKHKLSINQWALEDRPREKMIEKKKRYCKNKLYDTRGSCCLTPGCQHVQHPGVGVHETRVSYNLSLHRKKKKPATNFFFHCLYH